MTTTLTQTTGRFVWRELFVRDVDAAKRFYTGMFGWTPSDRPMGEWSYTVWQLDGRDIGGMMDIANLPGGGEGVPSFWSVYVSVDDVDAATKRAVDHGGKVVGDCHDIPGVGRFSVIQDPQGAHISLFRSVEGRPLPELCPPNHDFCWENLSTTNPDAAVAFYGKVVGWTHDGAGPSIVFNRKTEDGETVGVASVGPSPNGMSHWGTMIAVEDAKAELAKAEGLGAKTLMPVTEIPGVGAFCIMQDPCDAVFFMFQSAR